MGCDVHFNTEVKENGKWRLNTDRIFPNPYYEKNAKKDNTLSYNKFETTSPGPRNYDWFSILADVRNGFGFAGVETGEGFSVIANPRGLPEDVCEEIKNEVDVWGCDLHSITHLSIEDFDEFDWNQVTMKSGVIPMKQYLELRNTTNPPQMWSGGLGGGNNITISVEEAEKVIEGKLKVLTRVQRFNDETQTESVDYWNINVQYVWPVIYSEWFENRIKDTVEPLRILSKKYEDARLVFGFDN